jgi:hypothetical protein
MAQFVILGATPGDGGQVSAATPKEAIIKFIANSDGLTQKEVRAMMNAHPLKMIRRDANHFEYGSYEINKLR